MSVSLPNQAVGVGAGLPSGATSSSGLPVGMSIIMPSVGNTVNLSDGSVLLQSGTYSPASQYPAAARLQHLMVHGGGPGGASSTGLYGFTTVSNNILTLCNMAATASANIITSVDGGQTFNTYPSNLGVNVTDIAWVPWLSLFVAVGSSTTTIAFSTSPDGITWTSRGTVSATNINAGSAFVGVGTSDIIVACSSASSTNWIARSTNGTTWAVQTAPSVGSNSITRPVNNGTTWVIGSTTSSSNFVTSTNGTTWTQRTAAIAATDQYGLISTITGLFILPSSSTNSTYYTSPDGITWTIRNAGFGSVAIPGYLYSDGSRVIGTLSSGLLAITTDGLSWSQHGFVQAGGTYYGGAKCTNGMVWFPYNSTTLLSITAPAWPFPDFVGSTVNQMIGASGTAGSVYYKVK